MLKFIAMNGYGFYVWAAFGMAMVVMMGNIFYSRSIRRTLFKRLGHRFLNESST